MSAIAQELISKLAILSKEARMELTVYLLDQLQQDDDPDWRTAWTQELARRENDPRYIPADEVFRIVAVAHTKR